MYGVLLMASSLLFAADDPKPQPLPAPAQAVLDGYLKAIAAKDLAAMAAAADVPWLDRDQKLVRDKDGLAKAVERVATQLPTGERKVEAFPYKALRGRIPNEAERKLLDEVLGDDGWLVSVERDGYPFSMRTFLIRMKAGKAAVVGGPLKQNQLSPQNRIPDVVERLLDKADSFELYSLDPDRGLGKPVPEKDGFHGWKVLGTTEVKKEADRKRLTDALRLGAEDNFGAVAACFIPRHGIRLKGGGKVVDVVICFQCLSTHVYVDGKQVEGFLTTGDPQEAFDAVLKAVGVKLPKQAKE